MIAILVGADDQNHGDQPQPIVNLPVFFGLKPMLCRQGLEEGVVHELDRVRHTWLHVLFMIIIYVRQPSGWYSDMRDKPRLSEPFYERNDNIWRYGQSPSRYSCIPFIK